MSTYSLLMSGNDEKWDTGNATFETDRFLEYTVQPLKEKYKDLSDATLDALKSMPTLFAYERGCERSARVGKIDTISRRASGLEIRFSFDPSFDPIAPEQFATLLRKLDIDDKMEIHRTHWAIKEVDLPAVLTAAGIYAKSKTSVNSFRFSRATVIAATTMLKSLGHAELDEFIMELGLAELNAGRGVGGRQARAAAIGSFYSSEPDAVTATGEPLSLEIVRKAALLDHKYPEGVLYEVAEGQRERFWKNLDNDGYTLEDGQLVSKQAAVNHTVHAAKEGKIRMSAKAPRSGPASVFIVHGREDGPKEAVSRFLERIGLRAVILHEQPNAGRTIFQKFQDVASEAEFAVVLMTPDDVGGLPNFEPQPRARQNVIFELGFFVAKLGPTKVCALVVGQIETPSDYGAVVYVPYGANTNWKTELARELRDAGIAFDASKVF